jgi:hypothetical protein
MRKITLRFPESVIRLLEAEAAIDETSVSQFVRDATLLRIGFRMAARGEVVEPAAAVEAVLREARKRES